jgi:dTDP-4-dehydrorhamnose reductase
MHAWRDNRGEKSPQPDMQTAAIDIWGGVECTLNRVGDQWHDQIERSGHARRESDLDLIAGLGIRTLRYPVLWERVAPAALDAPDWSWTDARLAKLRALGINPIAGLMHHGSGPAYTSLIDPGFPGLLERFAEQVAERYPWIRDYTPINEPLTTARFSGLYGVWYPHQRSDKAFVRALLNQTWGTVLAMRAIRRINPDARLIQTEDCGRCFGTRVTSRQVTFENHRRWLTWDLLTGRVDDTHPLYPYLLEHGATAQELDRLRAHATPPAVVGLNYYLSSDRFLDHRLDRYPVQLHGGNGIIRYADVEAVRAREDQIPGHEAHLLDAWRRYRLPVAMTEVHLGCTREEQVRWLLEAWHGAHAAARQGAHVVAITPWALLGSYDWDTLVTNLRGYYEPGAFDVRSAAPRPTRVASAIRELASGITPGHGGSHSRGWWRRPSRLRYCKPKRGADARRTARKPLLVLGATGTLGRAIDRLCEHRGLAVYCATRRDVDITVPHAVLSILKKVEPWAVINATGYVRVDDAERDCDACFGVNTIGAVTVAGACQQHGIPYVTYSSDLVFDGSRATPYTEADTPRPLNVYGASKAEAERRVLETMPGALVIRTSAFFGPWDAHNFVVQTLQAIRRGQRVSAAGDIVVSPTYVPDLVDATLDLLMDGETGLWHLANGGATTWFDFACEAAEVCGERTELIQRVATSELGWPAARPSYSALASVRGEVMRPRDKALAAFAENQEWRDRLVTA